MPPMREFSIRTCGLRWIGAFVFLDFLCSIGHWRLLQNGVWQQERQPFDCPSVLCPALHPPPYAWLNGTALSLCCPGPPFRPLEASPRWSLAVAAKLLCRRGQAVRLKEDVAAGLETLSSDFRTAVREGGVAGAAGTRELCEEFAAPRAPSPSGAKRAPRVAWTVWIGPPLSGGRLQAWRDMQENVGMPVRLVTADTLGDLNLSHAPIHAAFRYLSGNHKGDYLKAYLMHHYGGFFMDMKRALPNRSWDQYYDLFRDPEVWAIKADFPQLAGWAACDEANVREPWCEELRRDANVSQYDADRGLREGYQWLRGKVLPDPSERTPCCHVVRSAWTMLTSACHFIFRPGTNLSGEWLGLVHEHLDAKFNDLKQNPPRRSRCCAPWEEKEFSYPLRWAEIAGEILGPVSLKYGDHLHGGLPYPWDPFGTAYRGPE